jgi:hypothetical protein
MKRLLHAVASFWASVVLFIVYWLGLGPASLLMRAAGSDPFKAGWREREDFEPSEHLRSQG